MFVTYTEWTEVGRFLWVCRGCSRECQVNSQTKPKDQEECDHSQKSTDMILAKYGGQIRGD